MKRKFLVSYKYINTAFRERFKSIAWTYDPEEHKMDIHEELLKAVYDDIKLNGRFLDQSGGESIAVTSIWEINNEYIG